MSKKESINLKNILIIVFVSLIFVIGACLGIVQIIKKNNVAPSEEEQEENAQNPTLNVPSLIHLYLLNNSEKFSYEINNLGNHAVNCYVEDVTIAIIGTDLTITPLKVGTTKIITKINCEPEIKKETTLIIKPVVSDVELKIVDLSNNEISEFYTNTTYTLVVTENIETDIIPEFLYSDNVVDFIFIKKENLSYFFTFNISEFGNFKFKYTSDYYNEEITYYSYKLPTDFEVTFTRSNIYLFDENCLINANENNIFGDCEFEIILQENTNDYVEIISYDDTIIKLVDNKIFAKSKGNSQIIFKSKISGVEKSFNIVVDEIILGKIKVNNTEYSIGENISFDLYKEESIDFIFDKIPTYANDDLNISYNKEEVSYENNKLQLINDTLNSEIYVKDKTGITVFTIQLNMIETYKLEIFLTDQNYLDVEFKGDSLEIGFVEGGYIQISCYSINELTKIKTQIQNPRVVIKDTSVCEIYDKIINGNVNLKIKSKGTTIITIYYDELKIEKVLTVVVE